MTKLSIVESFAYVMRPLLKFGGVDFDGGATHATGEVVVVRLDDASSIEAFAAVGHHDIDFAIFDQFLQLRVDRRQGDPPAVSFDQRMEFLGTHEALQLAQDANDLSPLHRISGRGHGFIVVVVSLLSRTVLINVVGIILERKFQ